ncbi:hypothetical protein FOL47_004204 [Perkinsus chesapeaki]|uniref:Uncharacterized protein n=1 Tax=Perkinsus chesapeaki TaxID=330153 RepID=A0A7J6M3Y3_PERCH|nr:hypothetical protein FOL47_004204 [Perkinsus chesapeaki]
MIFTSFWVFCWFAFVLVQVDGIVFGPRGMYCSSQDVGGGNLPILVMHFTPSLYHSWPGPTLYGYFRIHGLSHNGTYSCIVDDEIGYTAIPAGDVIEDFPTSLYLPNTNPIGRFASAMGLESPLPLVEMQYKYDNHGIGYVQVATSSGDVRLTFARCQQSFFTRTFCSTPSYDDSSFYIAISEGELSMSIGGLPVYRGRYLLDTDHSPMNVSLVKSKENHFDPIFKFMHNETEAFHEYFWNRGEALSWDPMRQRMKLHHGRFLEGGSHSPLPDVVLNPC